MSNSSPSAVRMKVANSNGLVKSACPVQIGGRSTVRMRAVGLTVDFSTSPFLDFVLPAAAASRCLGVIFCLISRSSVRGEEKWILGRTPVGQVRMKASSVSRRSARSGFRHQKC